MSTSAMARKIWNRDPTDVMKFSITRKEWELIIIALAGAAVWAPVDNRNDAWAALDAIKNAEDCREE